VYCHGIQALGIVKSNGDQIDLSTCKYLWLEDGLRVRQNDVVSCARIGIANYAGDWTEKPLRFYLRGNKCVSVRDRDAERSLAATNDSL